MAHIHPTAIVDAQAELHESVHVGPYAVIGAHVRIGANTSMFSILNSYMLRPAPYADRDHLDRIYRAVRQNARGGIAGRRLTLLSRDDESRPERAIGAAEELSGRHHAVGLIGGYVDSLVGPVAEVAARARVPYLATASLDERLTERHDRRTPCGVARYHRGRHRRDAAPDDLAGAQGVDRLTAEGDRSGRRAHETEDGLHRRRLARGVAAEERHDLALVDLVAHALQHVERAIVGVDVREAEDGLTGHGAHRASRGLTPRAAGGRGTPRSPSRRCGRAWARPRRS